MINDRLPEIPGRAIAATDEEIIERSDFIVALGGDGTMLTVACLLQYRSTPVLGINLGTLGYLTEFTIEEAIPALEEIFYNTYTLDRIGTRYLFTACRTLVEVCVEVCTSSD